MSAKEGKETMGLAYQITDTGDLVFVMTRELLDGMNSDPNRDLRMDKMYARDAAIELFGQAYDEWVKTYYDN